MIPSSTLGLDDMIGALCVSPDRHQSVIVLLNIAVEIFSSVVTSI
jgi:hypothetical protein